MLRNHMRVLFSRLLSYSCFTCLLIGCSSAAGEEVLLTSRGYPNGVTYEFFASGEKLEKTSTWNGKDKLKHSLVEVIDIAKNQIAKSKSGEIHLEYITLAVDDLSMKTYYYDVGFYSYNKGKDGEAQGLDYHMLVVLLDGTVIEGRKK
jgi:hypothetical protein